MRRDLIGRMAVDESAHGRGLRRMLLADAVKRTVATGESCGHNALIVDAANSDAKRFCERFTYVPLTEDPMRVFVSLGHDSLQGQKG